MGKTTNILRSRSWLLLLALFVLLMPQQAAADDGYDKFTDMSYNYNIYVSGTNTDSLLQRVEIMLGDGDFGGAMSKCDTILDSDPTNGNVYLIFAEGSSYSRYKISGSGRASVTSDANGNITINSSGYSNFGVATNTAAGTSGLVPAPSANQLGSAGYFLRAD